MRQKKSKTIFYIFGLVAIIAFIVVILVDVPMPVEQVEQIIDNNIITK